MVTSKQAALNLLGLAQRAGRLISGTDLVQTQMAQAKLVLIAAELSHSTTEKVAQAAQAHSVPLIKIFTGAELSHAIGRQRKVVAVTDAGFAQALIKKIN